MSLFHVKFYVICIFNGQEVNDKMYHRCLKKSNYSYPESHFYSSDHENLSQSFLYLTIMPCLQICLAWTGLLYWALSLLWYCSCVQWHLWLWWHTGKVFHMWISAPSLLHLRCNDCFPLWNRLFSSLHLFLTVKAAAEEKKKRYSLVLIRLKDSKI